MSYSYRDINVSALYVLKVDSNGEFFTDYLSIESNSALLESLKELRIRLRNLTIDKSLSKVDIYNAKKQMIIDYWVSIKNNYAYLFGFRNYCSKISSSYVSMPGISNDFEFEIMPFDETVNEIRIKKGASYTTFDDLFNNFFESYFIEEAYKKCINDSSIKAYSHRRTGWIAYNFELNKIFAVNVKSNFGYGYANYFCVTLIFNGIPIIPYSRLVMYYRANLYQLIRHTWEYYIDDSSWELAFDMVKDACNNYKQNGRDNFVKAYLIDELEKLTSKLIEYLDVNKFELSENEYGNYIVRNESRKRNVELTSYPLIIFRGEKVAGSIVFIDSITKLNKFLPTNKYVDIINRCCVKILPQFDKSLADLNLIIRRLEMDQKAENDSLEKIIVEFDVLESLIEMYKETEEALKYELDETVDENVSNGISEVAIIIRNKMLNKHPDWEEKTQAYHKIKELVDAQKEKCTDISNELYYHNSYFTEISEYNEKVRTYLKSQ